MFTLFHSPPLILPIILVSFSWIYMLFSLFHFISFSLCRIRILTRVDAFFPSHVFCFPILFQIFLHSGPLFCCPFPTPLQNSVLYLVTFPSFPATTIILFWNYCFNISSSRAQAFLSSFIPLVLFTTPNSIFSSSISHAYLFSYLHFFLFLPPIAKASHCPQVQEVMLQQAVPGSLPPAAGACYRGCANCCSVLNSATAHISTDVAIIHHKSSLTITQPTDSHHCRKAQVSLLPAMKCA